MKQTDKLLLKYFDSHVEIETNENFKNGVHPLLQNKKIAIVLVLEDVYPNPEDTSCICHIFFNKDDDKELSKKLFQFAIKGEFNGL